MVRKVLGFLLVVPLVAGCGRPPVKHESVPVAAPEPAPVPSTLDEVRQAETSGQMDAAEAGLHNLAASSDIGTRRRALALLGSLYEQSSRWPEAIKNYRLAATIYPEVAPFLWLRVAEVQNRMGEPLDAASTALQLSQASPGSSAARIARIELPAFYAAAGQHDTAAARLKDLQDLSIHSLNEAQFFDTATALEEAGFTDLSSRLRMRLLTQFPQGRFVEKLYAQLTADMNTSPLASLSYAQLIDLADRLGRVNRYDQSLDLMQRTAVRFPNESKAATFRYTRLIALFNSRHYNEVVAERFSPDEPYYLAAQLKRARAYWRTDRPSDFLRIIQSVISGYPKTTEANAARLLLSKYYMTDEVNYAKAESLLKEAIARGSEGDDGENLWTLGWIYTSAGRDELALGIFDQYLKSYPDADYTSNALFWSAKIHEKHARKVERDALFHRLIEFYPYTNYSYRAREILGISLDAPSTLASGFSFPAAETEATEEDARLVTVRELMGIGFTADAAREMQHLSASQPGDAVLAYHLADLYAAAGEPLKANVLIQKNFRNIVRHGGTGVPQRFWQILYPRANWPAIEKASARSGVDPYLVSAIIRQESAFDPSIVSNAGAVGLMQIMPVEASRIAVNGGLAPVTREQLFDPETNVMVGAAEIRQKIDAMDGNTMLGIAAYNAGEQAVGRWIAKTPPQDIDTFIESIPYSETRLYVKIVTRNVSEYRRIYGSP
ncbi:MAG: transglycosylase SLT domain-containing protein [Acidobacteriota bacterium]